MEKLMSRQRVLQLAGLIVITVITVTVLGVCVSFAGCASYRSNVGEYESHVGVFTDQGFTPIRTDYTSDAGSERCVETDRTGENKTCSIPSH